MVNNVHKLINAVEKAKKETGLSGASMKKCVKYLKNLKSLSPKDRENEANFYKKCINDTILEELDPQRDSEKYKDKYDDKD